MKLLRQAAVLAGGCMLWLGVALPSDARACGDVAWDYSVESLQKARNRVKSSGHPSVLSRVQCGLAIVDVLKGVLNFPTDCPQCRLEYIQLLQDTIFFTRALAEQSSSQANKKTYYQREIDTRLLLGDFLVSSGDAALIDRFWSKNFEGLGDAMERAGLGLQFHETARNARDRALSQKTFATWAKAVRSCSAWDFVKGQNMDMPGLRKQLLCVEDCTRALRRIRNRAESAGIADRQAMIDLLDDLLPALEACPVEARNE